MTGIITQLAGEYPALTFLRNSEVAAGVPVLAWWLVGYMAKEWKT